MDGDVSTCFYSRVDRQHPFQTPLQIKLIFTIIFIRGAMNNIFHEMRNPCVDDQMTSWSG